MDFEGVMLSEASQAEKDKYCMIPLICVESEKNQQTSEYNKKDANSQILEKN